MNVMLNLGFNDSFRSNGMVMMGWDCKCDCVTDCAIDCTGDCACDCGDDD